MRELKTAADFKCLKQKEKFYRIAKGHSETYLYIDQHPVIDGVVAIKGNSYTTAQVFAEKIMQYERYFCGEYDSKVIGEAMKLQLAHEIMAVENIYINKTI